MNGQILNFDIIIIYKINLIYCNLVRIEVLKPHESYSLRNVPIGQSDGSATWPDNLNLIPGNHIIERESQFPKAII